MSKANDIDEVLGFLERNPDIDLAIWDFDGVVADSEEIHADTYKAILEEYGAEPEDGFFASYIGHSEPVIWKQMAGDFSLGPIDINDLWVRRVEEAKKRIIDIDPNWFVTPLMDKLESLSARQVVISSGNLPVIETFLTYHDIIGRFDEITASMPGEEPVDKAEAFKSLARSSRRSLLIEDSLRFLSLGKELGCSLIGIEHSLNNEKNLDISNYVLVS